MLPSEPPSQFVSAILERWEGNSSKKFLTLNFKTYAKIRFISTGGNGSGSPIPRNIGLDAAGFEYSAILDGDDQMHPQKLEFPVAQLQYHPIISCALQLLTKEYKPLPIVGAGADRILTCRDYKFTNFSSDSMLLDDRRIADPRFDPRLSCVSDFDCLLKLFSKIERCLHFGKTLHSYVKRRISLTNGPGASQKIANTKRLMVELLSFGPYSFPDSQSVLDVEHFVKLSLMAEAVYSDALLCDPEAVFEDYIEEAIRSGTDDLFESKNDSPVTCDVS